MLSGGVTVVYVIESALKHGLSEDDIVSAWENVFEYVRCRHKKMPPHYMALGTLQNGRTVELVAFSTGLDWYVFHAMTPPTAGFMHEYRRNGGAT